MACNLNDILVICCMDGTLYSAKDGIPDCNKATIALFEKLGGKFTVFSQRTPESVRTILGEIQLTAPALTCNGSVLFDFSDNRHIDKKFLPYETIFPLVYSVMNQFPDIGVEIYTQDGRIYIPQSTRYTQKHLLNERIGCIISPLEAIQNCWVKVSFVADPVGILKLKQVLKIENIDSFYIQEINQNCYELAPKSAEPKTLLHDICARENILPNNVVVIGGTSDDCNLLRAAGFPVAVQNAPDDVKLIAQKIVSSCSCGGVGEYLYSLVKRYT